MTREPEYDAYGTEVERLYRIAAERGIDNEHGLYIDAGRGTGLVHIVKSDEAVQSAVYIVEPTAPDGPERRELTLSELKAFNDDFEAGREVGRHMRYGDPITQEKSVQADNQNNVKEICDMADTNMETDKGTTQQETTPAADKVSVSEMTTVVTQVVESILTSNLQQAKEVALQLQEIAKLMQEENDSLKVENAKLKGENSEIKGENKELSERMTAVIDKIESMHQNFKSATAKLPDFIRQSPEFKAFAEKQNKEFSELKMLAYKDNLTGLFNRNYLDTVSNGRNGNYVGFCVDIDHFKKINDTKGHDVGDQVLKEVGKIISDTVKGEHGREMYAFRLGGEEIGVLTRVRGGDENAEMAYVTSVAEKIRHNIEASGLCTVSVGVADRASKLPGKLEFKETFGDKNLYAAKQAGRNQVVSPVKVERMALAADKAPDNKAAEAEISRYDGPGGR